MESQVLLSWRGKVAFTAAIASLLIVGAAAYRSIAVSNEIDLKVAHTHEILEQLQTVLFSMTNIELSNRGFMVTGTESFLDSYDADVSTVQQNLAALRDSTADNPVQQRRLPALERLVAQKLGTLERVRGVRRAGGLDAALKAIQNGRGPQHTNEIQTIIHLLQNEELRLLTIGNATAKQNLRNTTALLIGGTVLGLLITAAAGWTVQKGSSRYGVTEKALRKSEEQYRALVHGIQDYGVVMLGPRGEFLSWNPGAERMTGCTFEEVAGQDFSYFFHPDDIKRGRPAEILRLAAEIGLYEEQGMRLSKDGKRFQVRASFRALRDQAGTLSGYSVISRDLSESIDADAKYRGLLEGAPDAMVVVRKGGEIALLNYRAENQFGYHRDELIGQQVKTIIPAGFAEWLTAGDTTSAAEALALQIGTGIELTGRRKDGSEFPVEIMLSPLESAEGVLMTAAIRDISVRNEMETQNARLHTKLRQAEKMEAIGTLAGGVAHEINNLLQPIIMMTELVLTELPEGGRHSTHLLRVVDAGNKAVEIVQRILTFGRMEEVALKVLDISFVVREAIAFIRTILPPSIHLHLDLGEIAGTVRGDKTQLVQVLINLAINARDAIGSDVGTVSISLSEWNARDNAPVTEVGKLPRGAYAVLSVQDTGSGMDDATARRIFEPFFTTKAVGKGSGLGLSITHGIVAGHGGAMHVERAPDRGTIFSIYLPIEENKAVLALAG